jgi:carbamoyl-phosphate synthase large subunit
MPKRTDLRKILVIGSGPIVIGQACEFDYSGTQACKALRAEGYEVVLINSNPATIMTDPEMADGTYIEPLTLEAVTAVLERERPDALLPTVGGQTALNLAMQLAQTGVLDRLGVQLIGANIAAIELAESRRQFKAAMEDIGLEMTKAMFVTPETNLEEVRAAIGYPAIVRPSFTLGGARRRHRLQRRGVLPDCRAGPGVESGSRSGRRGVRPGLERVRTRSHARRCRQHRDRVFD